MAQERRAACMIPARKPRTWGKARKTEAATLPARTKFCGLIVLASRTLPPQWPGRRGRYHHPINRFLAGFLPGFFKIKPSLIAFDKTADSVRPSFLLMNETGSFSKIIRRNISICSAVHRVFGWTMASPEWPRPSGLWGLSNDPDSTRAWALVGA